MFEHPIREAEFYEPSIEEAIYKEPEAELTSEEWSYFAAFLGEGGYQDGTFPILRRLMTPEQKTWIMDHNTDIRDLIEGTWKTSQESDVLNLFAFLNKRLGIKYFTII